MNLGKTFRIEKYNGSTLQQLYEKMEEDDESNKLSKCKVFIREY